MKIPPYKLLPNIHLIAIFFSVASLMLVFEYLKELFFQSRLTPLASHLTTVMVTAILAVLAAFYIRKMIENVNEQLSIAAIALETQQGMLITNADAIVIWVNQAFTKITGYLPEEMIGKNPRKLSSGRQDTNFYVAMWKSIQLTGEWKGEIWNRRKNGEIYPEYLTITAVKGRDARVSHYAATMDDITERKRLDEHINNLAFYDPLTQLPNRRLLKDRLLQSIASCKRTGCYGALIFLDLDNFKPLNDVYGHSVGDLLLIEVARRINGCVRETDTVARFGGDEFVVVLSVLNMDKVESIAQATRVAEKIQSSLARLYTLTTQQNSNIGSTVEHYCTASIGVALYLNHDVLPDKIIDWADTAMYRSKETGRNNIHFHHVNTFM